MNKDVFLRKAPAILTAVIVGSFLFSACGANNVETDTNVPNTPELGGIVLYADSLTDGEKSTEIASGVEEYARENGMRYDYIVPKSFDADYLENSISDKVTDGYTAVICTGLEYTDVISDLSDAYTDIEFIIVDAFTLTPKDNVISIIPSLYDIGYIAGYTEMTAGHVNVGCFIPVEIDGIGECANGFVSAVSDYATMHSDGSYTVSVAYADSLVMSESTEEIAISMYEKGCQSIFSFGAAVPSDCLNAAESCGKLFSRFKDGESSDNAEFSIVFDYGKAVKKALEGTLGSVDADGILTVNADDGCFEIILHSGADGILNTDGVNTVTETFSENGAPTSKVSLLDGEYDLPENVFLEFYG